MARAYTPGLTIKERTTVEKVRRLPLKGEVLVEEGAAVKADTVVARTYLPGNVYPLNGASMLNVEPHDLPGIMMKQVGDRVERGEHLARSRGFLGFFQTPLLAPVTGTVESVSAVTGQVILREPSVPVEIGAYLDGKVVKVLPEEGVVIRTSAALIQGIFGIGGEARGRITLKCDAPEEPLRPEAVGEQDRGRLLVAGSHLSADVYRKAAAAGAAGVVTGGISYGDLKEILGHEIGVAVTGGEEIGTPLVVTEGFGEIAMSRRTFDLIKKLDNRYASLNGTTQIRAGVIRPELIVPLETGAADERKVPGPGGAALDVGSLVRVIRMPRFGVTGKVTELPPEPRRMDSETVTRVVVIDTEDGERIVLPRANVEIIEA